MRNIAHPPDAEAHKPQERPFGGLLPLVLALAIPALLVMGCSDDGAGDQGSDESMAERGSMQFSCGKVGPVTLRFLDSDTVELSAAEQTHQLERRRSGSGAYFAGGTTQFWNKGNEAMLSLGNTKAKCRLSDEPQQ